MNDRIEELLAAGMADDNPVPPLPEDEAAARAMLTAEAVRERSARMLDLGLAGALADFEVRLEALPDLTARVVRAIHDGRSTPDLPLPACWRLFEAGGIDRWGELAEARGWETPEEKARSAIDLAVLATLLDGAAGDRWTFADPVGGELLHRSEGLAMASLAMFASGALSIVPEDPFRVDAGALMALTGDELASAFQVGTGNLMPGLAGRLALLNRLGHVVASDTASFAAADDPRPGCLYDRLVAMVEGRRLAASDVLDVVLKVFGPLWPGPIRLGGIDLGDSWRHAAVVSDDRASGIVPFHRAAQQLAYSLVEPLAAAGIKVTGLDHLTGLADAASCALFVDAGVLVLKDPAKATTRHPVGSPLVVEWRALTVALFDRMAGEIRRSLYRDPEKLSLAAVLEAAAAAGKVLARERRPGGAPPILVESDGTVF
jgi:hypothetical protein